MLVVPVKNSRAEAVFVARQYSQYTISSPIGSVMTLTHGSRLTIAVTLLTFLLGLEDALERVVMDILVVQKLGYNTRARQNLLCVVWC